MKKVIGIFIILSILIISVSCSKQTKSDINSYIEKNFEVKSINYVKQEPPPILGGSYNFFVSFINKSDNNCFLIVNEDLKKYLMIYDDSIIEDNTAKVKDNYKELINTELNPVNDGNDYTIESTLTDLKIKKVKTNLDEFKNGQIGEMHIQRKFNYKDKEKGKLVGPTEAEIIILFDTETKGCYEITEKNKQSN